MGLFPQASKNSIRSTIAPTSGDSNRLAVGSLRLRTPTPSSSKQYYALPICQSSTSNEVPDSGVAFRDSHVFVVCSLGCISSWIGYPSRALQVWVDIVLRRRETMLPPSPNPYATLRTRDSSTPGAINLLRRLVQCCRCLPASYLGIGTSSQMCNQRKTAWLWCFHGCS